MNAETTRCLEKGNRLAIISPLAEDRYTVWVGYADTDGSLGYEIGAFWFKGRRTCGAEYANLPNAIRAANNFLNH